MVVKRRLEQSKGQLRSWPIFFMDTSKQFFSAGLLHGYNILVSSLLSSYDQTESGSDPLECEWYFVNFTLDIFGIAGFAYLFIKLFNWALLKKGYEEVKMGEYSTGITTIEDITAEVKRKWLYQLLIHYVKYRANSVSFLQS